LPPGFLKRKSSKTIPILKPGKKEILEDYPDLEAGDIRACLQFASAQANHSVLHLVEVREKVPKNPSIP